jgi:23S rRNA pseudouridine1911/1915/1917 synthase
VTTDVGSAGAVRWQVPEELGGARLDRVVAALGGVSRSVARRLVEDGEVTLDGAGAAPSTRVAAGASVTASIPAGEEELQVATDVAFGVVWEDDEVVVVDKPPGLVVHPGAGHRNDTLANGLLYRYPALEKLGERHRWGIVHRIDRTTSGLLVVAKTADAHRALQAAMKRREVTRRYLAVAWGVFDAATGTVDAPIGRHPTQPTRRAVVAQGRPARTHYRRLAWWERPDLTLLDVRLETGRTHQIRVHLASIRHPIAGDRTYGRPGPAGADPGRVWLHAYRLAFRHPTTGAEIDVTSPLPDDLTASLGELGPPAGGAVPAEAIG